MRVVVEFGVARGALPRARFFKPVYKSVGRGSRESSVADRGDGVRSRDGARASVSIIRRDSMARRSCGALDRASSTRRRARRAARRKTRRVRGR